MENVVSFTDLQMLFRLGDRFGLAPRVHVCLGGVFLGRTLLDGLGRGRAERLA